MESSTTRIVGAVHELERGGHDAGRDNRRCHVRRRVDRHEVGEQRSNRLRLRGQLHGDVEREPEASLRADERPAQIVAVALTDPAAQLDDFAARAERPSSPARG